MGDHAPLSLSRRGFLAATLASPLAAAITTSAQKRPQLGLELFSVRQELAKDLFGTVRTVRKIGYEAVEFFSPYYQWEPSYARQVRQLLDEVGLKAPSTHNSSTVFTAVIVFTMMMKTEYWTMSTTIAQCDSPKMAK